MAALADEHFAVAVLRPPMIYGKGCRGNYQSLRRLILKTPMFPRCGNQRSMLVCRQSVPVHGPSAGKRTGRIVFPPEPGICLYRRTGPGDRQSQREKALAAERLRGIAVGPWPEKQSVPARYSAA
ncbi:MAG: hypothetical protein ACLUE8_07530 [Lachnospiraceae bacterium]